MAKFKIQGVSVVAKGYKHQMLHASCGGGGGGGGLSQAQVEMC